jgi:hypothetical protein
LCDRRNQLLGKRNDSQTPPPQIVGLAVSRRNRLKMRWTMACPRPPIVNALVVLDGLLADNYDPCCAKAAIGNLVIQIDPQAARPKM